MPDLTSCLGVVTRHLITSLEGHLEIRPSVGDANALRLDVVVRGQSLETGSCGGCEGAASVLSCERAHIPNGLLLVDGALESQHRIALRCWRWRGLVVYQP